MISFLILFTLNVLGDLLAIMTLPIFVLEKTHDFQKASLFTVIVLISTLLTSKLAGWLTEIVHPLRLTAAVDSIAVVFVLGLYAYLKTFPFDLMIFLSICGLMALVINIPMYAKYTLIHRYFVAEADQYHFSLIQGRISVVSAMVSILVVGYLYPRIGFDGILLIDAASYLPCIALFAFSGHKKQLGYQNSTDEKAGQQNPDAKGLQMGVAAATLLALYLSIDGFYALFDNLQAHLLLAVFKTEFQTMNLRSISLFAFLGVLASFALTVVTNQFYKKILEKQFYLLVLFLLLCGLVFYLPIQNWIKVILVSFLISEFSGISLAIVRHIQQRVQYFYPISKIVFYSLVVGCLGGAIGIAAFSQISTTFGFHMAFAVLAIVLLLIILKTRKGVRSLLKNGLAIFLFIIASSSGFSPHLYAVDVYVTAMSDRPRLVPTLTPKALTEDETFINYNTMCALIRRDVNLGLVPELAASWSISPDDKEITIRIKPDVSDGEGRRIDAAYVKESLEQQIQNTLNLKEQLRGFANIKGFESCSAKSCQLSGISLDSSQTLKISLTKPWPGFLGLLEESFFVYQHKVKNGKETIGSCGPYKFSEMQNEYFILTRNPNGVRKSIDGPENFKILFLKPESAYKEFCAGKINDLFFYMPSREDLTKHGCSDSAYNYVEVNSPGVWIISLASKKLNQKSHQRRRLIDNFDINKFRGTWSLPADPANNILPKEFGVLDSSSQINANQKTKSKPRTEGTTLVVRFIKGTPNEEKLVQALNEWGKSASVKMNIISTPFSEFENDLSSNQSDIYLYAEIASSSNPLHFFSFIYERVLENVSAEVKKTLTALWAKYEKTHDRGDLSQLEKSIRETNLILPVFVLKRPLVMNKNFRLERYGDFGLFNFEIDSFRKEGK